MTNNVVGEMTFDVNKCMEIDEACERVLVKTADAVKTDAIQRQVIPFDTGTLQRAGEVYYKSEDAAAYIEHDTPYASIVYFGDHLNFQTVNNKNAKARWYKDYEDGGSEAMFVIDAYTKFLQQEVAKYTTQEA